MRVLYLEFWTAKVMFKFWFENLSNSAAVIHTRMSPVVVSFFQHFQLIRLNRASTVLPCQGTENR